MLGLTELNEFFLIKKDIMGWEYSWGKKIENDWRISAWLSNGMFKRWENFMNRISQSK